MTSGGTHGEADLRTRTLAGLGALFVVGWSAGFWFLRHIDALARPGSAAATDVALFQAMLAVVCGTALAATFFFCRLWWSGLWPTPGGDRWRLRAGTIAGVLVPLGIVLVVLRVLTDSSPEGLDHRVADQTAPMTVFVAVCVVPGLAALLMVRAVARDDGRWPPPGLDRVRALTRLRGQERQLLTVLGAVLSLLVVSTGLRRQALHALDPGVREPAAAVALYGLVFAALLGGLHLLADQALDRRVAATVDAVAPSPRPDLSDLVDVLAARAALAAALGAGGASRSFQSAVIVAAPLLTALVGSAVSS